MTPAVAIVVVSWNTRELLDRCLQSMHADVEAGRAEVWVVDNGSTDGSPEMVGERHPWVRLLVPGENLGYGPAVNLAAAQTTAPWVAPSNADVELAPGALAALVEAGAREPRAGVLGPRLILPDGSTQPGVQPFPGLGVTLLGNLSLHRLHRRIAERLCLPGHWDPARPATVDWVTGAFLLVRREAWDRVGGFDADQWMYAEDLDLCWRISRAGWQVRYEPEARVTHALSVATAQAFGGVDERAARMLRADYDWLVRRRGRTRAAAIGAAQLATLGLRRAAFAVLARLRGGRWQARWAESDSAWRTHRAGVGGLLGAVRPGGAGR
jgi:GT2 family glycosyltransferase